MTILFFWIKTFSVQTWPVGPGIDLTPKVYLSTVLLSKAFYSLFLSLIYFSHTVSHWSGYLQFHHGYPAFIWHLAFYQENMALNVLHKLAIKSLTLVRSKQSSNLNRLYPPTCEHASKTVHNKLICCLFSFYLVYIIYLLARISVVFHLETNAPQIYILSQECMTVSRRQLKLCGYVIMFS